VSYALVAIDARFALFHGLLHIPLSNERLGMKVHGFIGMTIATFMRVIPLHLEPNMECEFFPLGFEFFPRVYRSTSLVK